VRVVAALLLFCVSALADRISEAADAVMKARQAGKGMGAIAARADPDPWLVADALCARGEYEAAEALAEATKGKDFERLPEFVANQKKTPTAKTLRAAYARASVANKAGDVKRALALLTDVGADQPDVVSVRIHYARGLLLRVALKPRESAQAYRTAAELAKRMGWIGQAAVCYSQCGHAAYDASDWDTALAANRDWLALEESRGQKARIALALGNLGSIHSSLGRNQKALEYQKRGLQLAEETGSLKGRVQGYANIGISHLGLGNLGEAILRLERARTLAKELGDSSTMSVVVNALAVVYSRIGETAKCIALHEEALAQARKQDNPYAIAASLGNLGIAYRGLGDLARAREYQEQSLAIDRRIGRREGVAASLNSLGNLYKQLGEFDKAIDYLREALELHAKLKDPRGMAATESAIAYLCEAQKDYARALTHHQRSFRHLESIEDSAGAAQCIGNIGAVHYFMGNREEALRLGEQALALARELGLAELEVSSLRNVAFLRMRRGEYERAIKLAREAIEKLPLLVGRLDTTLAAGAREKWRRLFDIGASAAWARNDATQAFFFIESGRAGTLLESLGGRERIRSVLIPPELRVEAAQARVREQAAVRTYRKALDREVGVEEAWARVNAARAATLAVVGRIQRSRKMQSNVAYPKAAELAEVQAKLTGGEGLVLYMTLKRLCALVVTRESARIVDLGEIGAIRTAVAKFRAAVVRPDERGMRAPEHERAPYLRSRLRKLLLDPLELEAATTRLLISPHEELAYVPFAFLAKREVVYVPSGTTLALLRETAPAERGKRVLALGDPEYGGRLAPLPESRKEAESIGDVVLVGKSAARQPLESRLGEDTRWRAIHLACHGMMQPDRPSLSALEFADGPLRCIDVFGMQFPSDLVVLSACETAQGKIYRAEGIVGFVQAFLVAGSPRVIVSLWKVDDAATRALMEKFYELWKPGKMPTATALKKAQEHVAAQSQWKHPYFWAAWQLWGLGE